MEPILAKADAFMTNIQDSIESIELQTLLGLDDGLYAGDFKITTMTVMVATNITTPLCLQTLKESRGADFPGSITMSTSDKDVFFNCVMCTYTDADAKRKGIKIFANGQLHITGSKTVHEAIECARILCVAIEASTNPRDFTVQMINGHFKFHLSGVLKLDAMHALCLKHTQHVSRYNPENHAGLLVRIESSDPGCNNCMTVVFFESGSVLINAFSCGSDLEKAYDFAVDFVSQHSASIVSAAASDGGVCKKKRRAKLATGTFDYGKYLVLK
jgi:TATA-box binding protein (TBP) (component of TFIID and TFIIIB)